MTEQAATEPSDSDTEQAPTGEASTDSTPESTSESTAESTADSTKDKFAAALAKKKADGQARSAHLDGHGGVGGATASHKATRQFRRKSG